jgi:glucose-1-phosphate thymidylyltransferase
MSPETVAIIPAAGIGTRLRPHTHTRPKALLPVAGKPMLGHILDHLEAVGIRRVVLIVGYFGDRVVEYVKRSHPRIESTFVDQPEQLGLGHAVSLAAAHITGGPILIVLGDTIVEADLATMISGGVSRIAVKAVPDPRRFGIVETDDGVRVTRLVEKPEQPTSNLAIVGVYYFVDAAPLFAALAELRARDVRTRGELQLTDAMELLVERGAAIETFPIEGWHDCGKPETLLETNRVLLDRRGGAHQGTNGATVIHPVAIAPDAVLERCVVGPHVSVGAGARIADALVRDAIIGERAVVERTMIEGSVIGEEAIVRGSFRRLNVGDGSEVMEG